MKTTPPAQDDPESRRQSGPDRGALTECVDRGRWVSSCASRAIPSMMQRSWRAVSAGVCQAALDARCRKTGVMGQQGRVHPRLRRLNGANSHKPTNHKTRRVLRHWVTDGRAGSCGGVRALSSGCHCSLRLKPSKRPQHFWRVECAARRALRRTAVSTTWSSARCSNAFGAARVFLFGGSVLEPSVHRFGVDAKRLSQPSALDPDEQGISWSSKGREQGFLANIPFSFFLSFGWCKAAPVSGP